MSEFYKSESKKELTIQEKIKILREKLSEVYTKGFSLLGHMTSEKSAQSIIKNGLKTRNYTLDSSAVPLFDGILPYEKQSDECLERILNYRHHDYNYVVLIAIPNPKKEEPGGKIYFDSVFENLPDDEKIETGMFGVDASYILPNKFIKGYLDLENLELIKNEAYDQKAKVFVKENQPRLESKIVFKDIPIPKPNKKTMVSGDDIW